MLEQLIEQSEAEKKVVFIDEIPWMDTPRSNFITALEYFWNSFASARKDVILIVCGSATSWIINKVLKNHGGLHNRVNLRISLQPFTLHECELYAKSIGMRTTRYELLEYYMVLGGVAFYWSLLDKGKSVAQNIDSLLFSITGQLHNEFNELYDSLFNNPEPYLKVINVLGTIKVGMSRTELLEKIGLSSGANITRILDDLEACGFIRKYNAFGKKRNDTIYQLIDNFTLFYFKFMKDNKGGGRHTPFFSGYRPQFYFRTTDVTGTIKLPDGVEMVMPGDNIEMEITLITPIAMDEGLRFAIREGGRTVASGVVHNIIE